MAVRNWAAECCPIILLCGLTAVIGERRSSTVT